MTKYANNTIRYVSYEFDYKNWYSQIVRSEYSLEEICLYDGYFANSVYDNHVLPVRPDKIDFFGSKNESFYIYPMIDLKFNVSAIKIYDSYEEASIDNFQKLPDKQIATFQPGSKDKVYLTEVSYYDLTNFLYQLGGIKGAIMGLFMLFGSNKISMKILELKEDLKISKSSLNT